MLETKQKQRSPERWEAKPASLTEWRADFSAARKALKEGGYKGSLVLKKGMPMCMKIQELRHARAALPSAYMSSGSGATAAQACKRTCAPTLPRPQSGRNIPFYELHSDALREAPPSLRIRSKRGDENMRIHFASKNRQD